MHDLKLFGDKVVRSYNSFVPLFDFLYHNPSPQPHDKLLMRGYYYKSQLFNWYSARTDNVINTVHSIVGAQSPKGFPLADISGYFAKTRETTLQKEHLRNVSIRSIILNIVYVENFGSSPFDVAYKGNEPHVDHIYPRSLLKSRLGLPTAEINAIGNYRFVGATDNIRKRAELPDSYFGRLRSAKIDIAPHLLVPEFANDPSRLKFDVDTYRRFRDERLNLVLQTAIRVVNP